LAVVLNSARGDAQNISDQITLAARTAAVELRIDFGSRVRLDGGRLHLFMAPEVSASGVLRVLGEVLVGRLANFDQFESLEATTLRIDARRPRIGVAIDGEVTVLRPPLRYRIRPGALQVAVPPVGD